MSDTSQPTSSASSLAGGVWRDFRRGLAPLVAYEILFKILAGVVFSPLSAWLLAALVSSTGHLAIGNEEILAFLLSPLGVATLVVMGTVGFAISMVEQAGLLLIAAAAQQGERPRTVAVLAELAGQAPRLVKLAFLQVSAYLACLLPFALAAGVTYLGLLSEYNINYYLAEKPPAFWTAVAIGGVLLAGLTIVWGTLYVRWVLALPACVLSGEPAVASLRSGFRLSRGTFRRLATALFVWLLAVAGLGLAVAVLLDLADRLILAAVGESLAMVVPTVAALVVVNVLAAAGVAFVGAATHGLLVARLYRAARQRSGEPLPAPPLAEAAVGVPAIAEWLLRKRGLFATAAVLLTATLAISHLIVEALDFEDRVAITAHRGSSLIAPENSLSAVRAAIQQGADYAEIDVQETADGVVVVFHDDDLMRVAGVNKKIWEIDYEELSDLDAGSWFSEEFRGEPVPRLEEVIALAQGRIKLNIELKFNGHDKKLAERTVAIIREAGFQDQCVLSSLNYEGLMDAKKLAGDLQVGYIVFRSIGDLAAQEVNFFSLNADSVTAELIDRLHARGKQVHVWTVNDPDRMSQLVDLGVDNIITDDPPAMIARLQERAALSNTEKVLMMFRHWLAR